MKPTGHVVAGGILGGITAIIFNVSVGIGVFLGSLAPDVDHIFFFWQVEKNPRKMFSVKRFFQIFEIFYRQSAEKQWLEIAFLHSIEVCLLIFLVALKLNSGLLYGLLMAMILHCLLDYWDFYRRRESMRLRCWSIIQYFIRKFFLKERKTYFDLWPPSN